ncbi:MAG: hypothetical protein WAW92_03005 [Minisyncoccia bacterium]
MLTVIVLSFFAAFVLLAIGLVVGKTPTTNTTNATTANATPATTQTLLSDRPKGAGGVYDPLQRFGAVHWTPNLIRAVVTGDDHSGPIVGIVTAPGRKYVPNGAPGDPKKKFVDDDTTTVPLDQSSWKRMDRLLNESFAQWIVRVILGRRIYGFPFVHKLRPLWIDRVTERATVPGEARTLEETLEASPELRYGLYEYFQRPTILANRDAGDNTRFTVKITTFIETLDPIPTFKIHPDNFLQMIDAAVAGFKKQGIVNKDYDDYRKSQTKELKLADLADLNSLLEVLGFRAYLLIEDDPQLHPANQLARDREANAKADANVVKTETEAKAKAIERLAEANKKSAILAAEAKARAIELETAATEKQIKAYAAAHGQEVVDIFNAFKGKGFSEDEALKMTHEQILERVRSAAVSGFQGDVYAPGGGVGVNYNTKTTPNNNSV